MQPQSMPTFSDAGSLVDFPVSVTDEPPAPEAESDTEADTSDDLLDEGPDVEVPPISDEDLMADAGVEQVFSTTEAAEFFGKTNQWLYWGMRPDRKTGEIVFSYEDGTPIRPDRADDEIKGRRRFTLPIIKEILMASYRRGNVDPEELKRVLRRIYIARQGGEWRKAEGWHLVDIGRNRVRWVHPDRCEFLDGRWVLRKTAQGDSAHDD